MKKIIVIILILFFINNVQAITTDTIQNADNSNGGLWREYFHFNITADGTAIYKIIINTTHIIIYNTKGNIEISGSITNSNFWDYILSNCNDIRVFNQSSQLYFYIEKCNYLNEIIVWVNLTNGSNELNIVYGNTNATKSAYENPDQVFEAYDLTTFTEYDPSGRITVNGAQSVTLTNVGGKDDLYLVKSITQQPLTLEFSIEATSMTKYSRMGIGFAENMASWYDNTNGFVWAEFARSSGNYHSISILNNSSITTIDIISLSLNTKYYVRVVYDGTNAKVEIYSDSAFTNLLGSQSATAPTPFNYVGIFGWHQTTLSVSGDFDATIDMFRVYKLADPVTFTSFSIINIETQGTSFNQNNSLLYLALILALFSFIYTLSEKR